MAEQDNVETNPVLAVGLAGVALIGVLGSFLPPGLVDRMTASHEPSTSQPAPPEATRPTASVATESGMADMGGSQVAPVSEVATALSPQESAVVTEGLSAPDEVAPVAASEQTYSAASSVSSEPYTEPLQLDETEVETGFEAEEKQQPAQPPYREDPRLPPEPVYRQVPPWGGYPPPAYPPVYNPYYGQPPY